MDEGKWLIRFYEVDESVREDPIYDELCVYIKMISYYSSLGIPTESRCAQLVSSDLSALKHKYILQAIFIFDMRKTGNGKTYSDVHEFPRYN